MFSVLLVVVFDDGDERTLRRTSLCLKGERHFAESEVGGHRLFGLNKGYSCRAKCDLICLFLI